MFKVIFGHSAHYFKIGTMEHLHSVLIIPVTVVKSFKVHGPIATPLEAAVSRFTLSALTWLQI